MDSLSVVGIADNEGRNSLDVAKLLAVLTFGYRAEGDRSYYRVALDSFKLNAKIFKAVGRGIKVWHCSHGGVASVSRRAASRAYSFLVRKTRFAKMHVHVSKTGENKAI